MNNKIAIGLRPLLGLLITVLTILWSYISCAYFESEMAFCCIFLAIPIAVSCGSHIKKIDMTAFVLVALVSFGFLSILDIGSSDFMQSACAIAVGFWGVRIMAAYLMIYLRPKNKESRMGKMIANCDKTTTWLVLVVQALLCIAACVAFGGVYGIGVLITGVLVGFVFPILIYNIFDGVSEKSISYYICVTETLMIVVVSLLHVFVALR